MAAPSRKPGYTVDQYLAMEHAAEERHEFLDGAIFAMAGESLAHGRLSQNLSGLFYNQLKGTNCEALTKDTKVRSGPTPMSGHSARGLFSYPDLLVICGEPEFHDAFKDVILNPTVIVEVLSPKTEANDRGEKFIEYQTHNPTFQEYVLVSQDQPQIEMFTRQADGTWNYQRVAGLEASLAIPSIHCTLKLADVYERIVFPAVE